MSLNSLEREKSFCFRVHLKILFCYIRQYQSSVCQPVLRFKRTFSSKWSFLSCFVFSQTEDRGCLFKNAFVFTFILLSLWFYWLVTFGIRVKKVLVRRTQLSRMVESNVCYAVAVIHLLHPLIWCDSFIWTMYNHWLECIWRKTRRFLLDANSESYFAVKRGRLLWKQCIN